MDSTWTRAMIEAYTYAKSMNKSEQEAIAEAELMRK